jgi:hypothetical protein
LAAFILKYYSDKCSIDFADLTQRLVATLLSYESVEMRNTPVVDYKLVGLLAILDTIFTSQSVLAQSYDTLAQQLLYGYLFPNEMTELP